MCDNVQSHSLSPNAQRNALMRATNCFGKSPTVADPKGFPQEVPLELSYFTCSSRHDPLAMSAWSLLGLVRKFEKERFFSFGCFLKLQNCRWHCP